MLDSDIRFFAILSSPKRLCDFPQRVTITLASPREGLCRLQICSIGLAVLCCEFSQYEFTKTGTSYFVLIDAG